MSRVSVEQAAAVRTREVELRVHGMTCASCAASIERKLGQLGQLGSVSAAVNLVTERVRITAPAGLRLRGFRGTSVD
jgi:Cu+-exporting ATPase